MTTPSDNNQGLSGKSAQVVTSVEKWMLDELFDTADVGIVFTDMESRVIRANRLVSNAVKLTESGLIEVTGRGSGVCAVRGARYGNWHGSETERAHDSMTRRFGGPGWDWRRGRERPKPCP